MSIVELDKYQLIKINDLVKIEHVRNVGTRTNLYSKLSMIFGKNQIIANLKETTLKVFDNSDLESMYAWEYDIVTVPEENLAIYGALQLYLDFINLFIRLIEFFGKRNDN